MKKLSICIVLSLCVLLTACAKKPAETLPTEVVTLPTAAGPLTLSQVRMDATLWSSPNGATVNIEAVPSSYQDGMTAAFIVRLEGEDVENVACQWNGTAFTASADLNAEDGYCYYLSVDHGEAVEFTVNTPTQILEETLVNLASALESYCSVTVTETEFADQWFSIAAGEVSVQTPKLADGDTHVSCTAAKLILNREGEEIAQVELNLPEQQDDGLYRWSLGGTSFKVEQELENDQQLSLRLEASLSNNQVLEAEGGQWFINDGSLMMNVG